MRDARGFTLLELLAVTGIIGALASIALILYVNVQARGRISRAQADVRALTAAVGAYAAHMGSMPSEFDGLAVLATIATNTSGSSAGPFLASVPEPPAGGSPAWPPTSLYRVDIAPGGRNAPGHFLVCATGDGIVAHTAAGTPTCP